MPKIRDLGISVIPLTMRPPEIGGGGADVAEYQAAAKKKPPCDYTKKPPCDYTKKPCEHTRGCEPTLHPKCEPTDAFCEPTNARCEPTDGKKCNATKRPTTARKASAAALSDDAIAQLRQQLRQQIGTDILN